MLFKIAVLIACAGLQLAAAAGPYQPTWESLDTRPLPGWYDEAKIGIFLHWGVYSVPSICSVNASISRNTAAEWFWDFWENKDPFLVEYMQNHYPPNFQYADFAPMFKADLWDPDGWADLFAKAGAKYVVLTSKHHEGFTNWPSTRSFNWNSMEVGPRRDIVGEFVTAIRKQPSLHVGLYHSMFEWFNPLYLADAASGYKTQTFVADKAMPELYEIVNNYKPELIWSDGDWMAPSDYWNSTHFLAWLFNESPVKDTIVVNDRWGKDAWCKHGSYWNCADRFTPSGKWMANKWENAMTIDQGSWGFRRNAPLDVYLTPSDLIGFVVRTVAAGGNILLNVGPHADGTIAPIFQERLTQLGQWLSTNGEAIYGATVKPAQYNDPSSENVWYTKRGEKLYAISLEWPEDKSLTFNTTQVAGAKELTLLGYDGDISFTSSQAGLHVTLPGPTPPHASLQWAWSFLVEF